MLTFSASPDAPSGFEACALGPARWPLDPEGHPTEMVLPPLGPLTPIAAREGVGYALRGATCSLELYDPPPPLLREVQTLDLVPRGAFEDWPESVVDVEVTGRATNLIRRGDRAWVATFPRRVDGACRGIEGVLQPVDLERFELLPAVPAPPCLLLLEADPEGPGFFGVYRRGEAWFIGAFDEAGAPVRELAVPLVGGQGVSRFGDLLAVAGVLLLVGNVEIGEYSQGVVVRFDRALTVAELLPTNPDPETWSLAGPGFGAEVLLGNTYGDRLVPLDPLTLTRGSAIPLPTERDNEVRAGRLDLLPGGEFVHTGPWRRAASALTFLASRQVVGETGYYEEPAAVFGVVALEGAAEAWVGVTTLATGEGRLSRLRASERRFLPGSLHLGMGPVTFLFARPPSIYGLLPRTGTLFRFTP